MKKLLTAIFILQLIKVNAQVPTWQWAKSASCNNGGVGEGWNIASDASGYVYVTGFFIDSSITFDTLTLYSSNPDSGSVYVAKFDSLGNVLWAVNSGGTGYAAAYGITTDNWGNVYLTGYYSTQVIFGTDTLSIVNSPNIFIVKYDSSGNEKWAKGAGGLTGDVRSWSIAADPHGNVFITGDFISPTINIGSYTLNNNGYLDVFIAKYDSSGNVKWAKSAGSQYNDIGLSVASDQFGSAYITGGFNFPSISFDSTTLTSSGGYDMFLVKYDSSGNVMWARKGGGSSDDEGNCVAISSSNKIYVTGGYSSQTISFGSLSLVNTSGYQGGFLVKYDSSGNGLWVKGYTGGYSYNLALDSLENAYMSGAMNAPFTAGAINLSIPLNSVDAMFVSGYDSSGTTHWAKALQSGGDDNNGIAVGRNGSIYIAGDFYFTNPFIVGNDSLIQTGLEDIFVAKLGYGNGVGISEINKSENSILFPNPFHDKLNITTKENEQLEIILYDFTSRIIMQKKFVNSVSLNTGQLSRGLYLYEIRTKSGLCRKGKLVKD